jgi:hypothetical protein
MVKINTLLGGVVAFLLSGGQAHPLLSSTGRTLITTLSTMGNLLPKFMSKDQLLEKTWSYAYPLEFGNLFQILTSCFW